MTIFGIEWNKFLASGMAPREDMFAQHSAAWHVAREQCRRQAEKVRSEKRCARRRATGTSENRTIHCLTPGIQVDINPHEGDAA